eukprot:CAMPEP_0184694800 /NCGR_PEP_ID=MMETSP0313-20130426/2646_1 /TAXON_ID=2792 /ORGANISM="Porphyridium aerugineum, Strain SAG 1380-2" /LENGTH=371 /DNA_ID=CAMNT_0027153151 /DNA_START=115 /DNA_END=1230 /DNA_ORIENTATION=-
MSAPVTAPAAAATSSGDAKSDFMKVFDDLVVQLGSDIATTHDMPQYAKEYIHKSMTYNVPHGKLTRGLAVLQCYKSFMSGMNQPVTPELAYQANLLGWCVEFLQAFFLVADDIMDGSVTRRGQPCFFRLPEIGLKAVNDSLMLELMIYRILRLNFRDHPSYIHFVELIQDVTYTTELGQLLDLTSQQQPGNTNFDSFNFDTLYRIYKYKTAYYSFYLSVALGMRLAGVTDTMQYDVARKICLAIGEYFQAQDDYLDCFGDPEVIGKIGTDIEENKCTWMVVTALQKCGYEKGGDSENVHAIEVLKGNYGRSEKECVSKVKALYRELGVVDAFEAYEESSYKKIVGMIEEVRGMMPVGAFEFLLAKVYKRSK